MDKKNWARKMKKVIITGATGTIGMALLDNLVKNGIEVTIISRIGSKRVKNIVPHSLISVIECDFEKLEALSEQLNTDYDTFYHLAWNGGGAEERNDIELQLTNLPYILSAVKLAKLLGCKRFIGAGSQAEYGNVEGIISENTPANPNYAYGIVKLCAGQLSRLVCETYGIEHIWARILSVYGPYLNQDSVLAASIVALAQGESLRYTKCEQIWDYMYSEDAANAMYLLGEMGIPFKTYNIASGTVKKLSEFLGILKEQIRPEVTLRFGEIPYRQHQAMHLEADITPLREDTGFQTQYTFEQGIRKTIQWMRGFEYE